MCPLKSRIRYFLAFFLLVSVERASSSVEPASLLGDYPRILDASQDSEFADGAAQQLTDTFVKTLSRRNIRSAVYEAPETSQTRNTDVLDFIINRFLETLNEKSRELETKLKDSGEDIKALLKLVNHEVGVTIIDIGDDDTVALSAPGMMNWFQRYAFNFIKNEFSNNLYLQLTFTKLVQDEVKKSTPVLQELFNEYAIDLSDLNNLVDVVGSTRSSRAIDIVGGLIELLRVPLRTILSPIQTNIITVLDNLSDFALTLYVSTEPNNTVTKLIISFTNPVVLQVVKVIVSVEEYVNVIFNNILYGNGTTTTSDDSTARRKRDIEEVSLQQPRFTTTIIFTVIRALLSPLTSGINTLLKTAFINWLSTYYETIGVAITYPLKFVFQIVVNFVFPCTNCTSIV